MRAQGMVQVLQQTIGNPSLRLKPACRQAGLKLFSQPLAFSNPIPYICTCKIFDMNLVLNKVYFFFYFYFRVT